jgi:hypothetical protein
MIGTFCKRERMARPYQPKKTTRAKLYNAL